MSARPALRRVLAWLPVVLLLAIQAWLSSRSSLPVPDAFDRIPAGDKLVHAGYFFLIGLFTLNAARSFEGWSRLRTAVVVVVLGFTYGVADEVHQSFTPHRDVEALDVAADVTGAALAALVGERFLRGLRLGRKEVAGGQGFEPR